MKKLSALLALFILFFITVKAQVSDPLNVPSLNETEYHKVEVGFRMMPAYSMFSVSTQGGQVKEELTFGQGFGVMLAYNFTKNVGLQTELNYNSLSQKFKDNQISRKITVNYINIPLFLSLNTGKGKPVNFNFVAGPQVGFNTGCNVEPAGYGMDTPEAVLALKKNDLGLVFGTGLEYLLNPQKTLRIDIGFRGAFGLVDISDQSLSETAETYYVLDHARVKTYSGYFGLTCMF